MKITRPISSIAFVVTLFVAVLCESAAADNLAVTPAMPTASAPFTLDFDVELSGCSTFLNPPSVTAIGNTIALLLGTNCIVSTVHSPVHFSAPVTVAAPGTYNVTWQIGYEPDNHLSDAVSLGTVVVAAALYVTVIEYYNAEMDHYFMTSVPIEVALCNSGRAPCAGWAPTGESFETWAPGTADPPNNTPITKICRLYNDTFAGKSTHFYGTISDCLQTLALFPDWKQETSELFDAAYPEGFAPGTCNSPYRPVFRLYNNGMGGAPNHRFTTDKTVVEQMIAKGWVQEGEGSGLAVFCVPNVP